MNPLHYGVVVGINRYPDLRHLQRAKGDAEKFAAWLVDPEGGALPAGNVALITADDIRMPDGTLRESAIPTRKEVLNALFKFRKAVDAHIEDENHPEDWEHTRLYFYVSGHGIAPDSKDAALLLADAGPEWYGENLACSRLLAFFGESQTFKELVIFADCCRERVPNAPIGDLPWTRMSKDNGQVLTALGCATYFGDIALEPSDEANDAADPDSMRGYFTQALLEGLRQARDTDTKEINSNSLAIYVRQRVMDLTKDRPYPQQPTMDADPSQPIVFRTQTEVVGHTVTLKWSTPLPGKVLLRNGGAKTLDEHAPTAGDWVVRLPNGLYEVVLAEPAAGFSFRQDGIFKVWGEDRDVEL